MQGGGRNPAAFMHFMAVISCHRPVSISSEWKSAPTNSGALSCGPFPFCEKPQFGPTLFDVTSHANPFVEML